MKNSGVTDPVFNDFIYTILYNASYAEKRGLHGKYQKAAMSERAAKKFIQSATDDEKKELLAHFGYGFFWVLIREDFKREGLKEILDDFENDRKPKALKNILEQGIFVSSDREFLRLLSFTSRTIHHNQFYVDMEFKRQGYNLQKWSKRNFMERDMMVREVDESAVTLASAYLKASMEMSKMKERVGVSDVDIKVLLYLYANHNIAVSENHLGVYFLGVVTKKAINTSVKVLVKSNMISQENYGDGKKYTIASAGIKVTTEYFKTIFSK